MTAWRPTVRRAAALVGLALFASSMTSPALADTGEPLSADAGRTNQFDTLYQLQLASGVSGTVSTRGDEYANDGAGVTYSVSSTLPADPDLKNISMKMADGRWAVPQTFATSPTRQPDAAAVEDFITRGQTFVDAGTQLQWDGTRKTPLSGGVVHRQTSEPYPISCASFIGMALVGWDYTHTTYVANQNTAVGYRVDFHQDISTSKLWQANNLASWFYANGDLWLDTTGDYQRGDVLFFSAHNPRVQPGTASGARTTFGNVNHVAIYLGDGMLMHSTGVAAGQGVHVSRMGPSLQADLSFVARPRWTD